MKRACVVVCGEISQSPRMQFHALSLAENEFKVDIVGYATNSPYEQIKCNPLIKIKPLRRFPSSLNSIVIPIYLLIKIVWDLLFLIKTFIQIKTPDVLIIQNPPAIFLVPIAKLLKLIYWRKSKIILDWHNYGYTLLSMKYSHYPFIKNIYKYLEDKTGKMADLNICVSNAMKGDLLATRNIEAVVLYDYPQRFFAQSLDYKDMHTLFMKLFPSREGTHISKNESLLTIQLINGDIKLKPNRPALVMSSTSWTEDEDFTYLISAMDLYDSMKSSCLHMNTYPDILCIVTGKGPLKAHYAQLIKSKSYKHVDFRLLWLESADYPKLLGCADIGICLHNSSSGFDLPMKVLDMFGCGLPVIAFSYPTLFELVKPDENGLVFTEYKELFEKLKDLLTSFPPGSPSLIKMREHILLKRKFWSENWNYVMLPLLEITSSNIQTKEIKHD